MTLSSLFQASAERHSHLCPRQVLGVRMGLLAGRLLGLDLPQRDKRVLTIVETDGCAADGVAVATGCSVGRRTLRVEDFGKVAATFVDTRLDRAVRIVPRTEARRLAAAYAPVARDRWHEQLIGYQRMPCDLLLAWQWVELIVPVAAMISRPDARAVCHRCHEEIINEREMLRGGEALCRACAGEAYCRPVLPIAGAAGKCPPMVMSGNEEDGFERARSALPPVASVIGEPIVAPVGPAVPRIVLHRNHGLRQSIEELRP